MKATRRRSYSSHARPLVATLAGGALPSAADKAKAKRTFERGQEQSFAVFYPLASSKFETLEDACPQNHCDPSLEHEKNTGKTFQSLANVGLVVGVVGLGTAVTLFVIGEGPGPAQTNQATRTKLELGVGRVALSGSFQ